MGFVKCMLGHVYCNGRNSRVVHQWVGHL